MVRTLRMLRIAGSILMNYAVSITGTVSPAKLNNPYQGRYLPVIRSSQQQLRGSQQRFIRSHLINREGGDRTDLGKHCERRFLAFSGAWHSLKVRACWQLGYL